MNQMCVQPFTVRTLGCITALQLFVADQALRLGSCAAAMNLSVTDSVSGAKPYAETIALDSKFARRD